MKIRLVFKYFSRQKLAWKFSCFVIPRKDVLKVTRKLNDFRFVSNDELLHDSCAILLQERKSRQSKYPLVKYFCKMKDH